MGITCSLTSASSAASWLLLQATAAEPPRAFVSLPSSAAAAPVSHRAQDSRIVEAALPRRANLGSTALAVAAAGLAGSTCSSSWRQRRDLLPKRRRIGKHQQVLVALRAEYLEEFDALGKELKGKAIVVGWDPGPDKGAPGSGPTFTPEESLEELVSLCGTLGLEVVDRVLQQWRPNTGRLPIRSGKAEEIHEQVKNDPDIGVVVFDQDMPYKVLMIIKGKIAPHDECVILDRTSLILRIFAERARTKEAKLQVQLASQKYMLPRLRYYLTTGAGMEAQGGSAGGSGAGGGGAYLKGKGETQVNMDKNMMLKRISGVKEKLEEVRKQRGEVRKRHSELGIPLVSLVGYTNAGKSTLMNQLCKTLQVKAKDRLFETLDTTTRRVTLEGRRDILLADTVGFIQRLPEELVMGFRATLEEVVGTTMILHVVDVASPTAAQQVKTVLKTLTRLRGFDPNTPQLLLYNKIDKLEGGLSEELEQSLTYPMPGIVGHCQISALKGIGFSALAEAIEDTLVKHTDFGAARMHLLIPYTESSLYAKMRNDSTAKINHEEHTNEGYLLEVTASKDAERQLKKYEVTEEEAKALSLA